MTRWTASDIAAAYGVERRTVVAYWTKKPDFPAPVIRINRKLVWWLREEVERWATPAERRSSAP